MNRSRSRLRVAAKRAAVDVGVRRLVAQLDAGDMADVLEVQPVYEGADTHVCMLVSRMPPCHDDTLDFHAVAVLRCNRSHYGGGGG